MAEKLTPQQQCAVSDRGGKLLVSAAAGSGKTKVLVDRLLSYLTDPVDPANIDDFLIITYTKAAAAELRGKIAAKLSQRIAEEPENRHLQRQMQRLYLAKISTVHAFCTDLLREHAYRLDISADFRVAEENECLELQLRTRSDVDPLCYELIRLYLLESFRGNLRQIARETGATLAHVKACVDVIRGLSPAPCSLGEGAVQYITPEFSVEAGEDNQLTLLFHNDYYPTIRQDDNFRRLPQTMTGDELAYARHMLTSADQLIRAVELRQTTLEKLARIIVREQRPFFLGQYSLLPLRVDRIAEEIGVHETTVYRALQGKYLYCSRGSFPLSHFFQKEVSGGTSAARVKEIIRELCRENDRLSDRAIAEALEERGITLSRRTVAKYRSQMEIDSSFRRRAD